MYDTVYETKYRDVEKKAYRDVEETYQVDVPIVKRLLHEHTSDGDEYDSSDYKNTHSHGPGSSDFYGFGESKYLDSDFSDEIHYDGDDSRVLDDSSPSEVSSVSSDVTGQPRKLKDDDDNRYRGIRPRVYAADLSSEFLGTEELPEDAASSSDAESREQCIPGRCGYIKERYSSRFIPDPSGGYEKGGDSLSSDDNDQSDDDHYHRFEEIVQEDRTRIVKEPFTVIEKEAFKVAKKVPKTVYRTEKYTVPVKRPVYRRGYH